MPGGRSSVAALMAQAGREQGTRQVASLTKKRDRRSRRPARQFDGGSRQRNRSHFFRIAGGSSMRNQKVRGSFDQGIRIRNLPGKLNKYVRSHAVAPKREAFWRECNPQRKKQVHTICQRDGSWIARASVGPLSQQRATRRLLHHEQEHLGGAHVGLLHEDYGVSSKPTPDEVYDPTLDVRESGWIGRVAKMVPGMDRVVLLKASSDFGGQPLVAAAVETHIQNLREV